METRATVNPEIFRAYDIRGIVGIDIDTSVAELLGMAIGTYLLGRGKGNDVAVGMDNRLSSEELSMSLITGLRSTGCNVINIGLCTSPMLYAATYDGQYCGGVVVSASHNPKEYNGFKVVGEQAYPIAGEEILKIRDLALSRDFVIGSGTYTTANLEEAYLERIQSIIHMDRRLKVVVDTGNGVAGKFAPKLLRRLGCEVVEVFCDLDGTFPNHVPNPEHESNLTAAKQAVVDSHADLGVGIDGDGDRVGIIDETGHYLSADYTIILLAEDYLARHPGEQVLVDVKSSQNVLDAILQNGGKPVLYKTGHSLIKMKMRADGIGLGGEFSGHMYVFEDYYPFDDALYVTAKILSILAKGSKKLSTKFVGLKELYATSLLELKCDDSTKFEVIAQITDQLSKSHDVLNIDGVRISFREGWAILRASNTTPYLTFRAEGRSLSGLKEILHEMHEIMRPYQSIAIEPLASAIENLERQEVIKMLDESLYNRWIEYSGGSRPGSNMIMFKKGEHPHLHVRYVFDWDTMDIVDLAFEITSSDLERLVEELRTQGHSSLSKNSESQDLVFEWELTGGKVRIRLDGSALGGVQGKSRYRMTGFSELILG